MKKKSPSSFLGMLMSCCCSGGRDDSWDEAVQVGRICPSDEDRRNYVAEPGIDWKASAFIAKFHESRFSDPGPETVAY